MRTGLYAQIEERGADEPMIARIRTKDSVYSWSAFFSRKDAEKWIEREYVATKIRLMEEANTFPQQ